MILGIRFLYDVTHSSSASSQTSTKHRQNEIMYRNIHFLVAADLLRILSVRYGVRHEATKNYTP
jgi:hypothetical protein